ncbi:MAG: coenzyme transferase [Lacrimispora sp.]|jgi:glutaconate CoA-transferase subunit B|nr:coenzyme transferase [Lacrimispora sp.]
MMEKDNRICDIMVCAMARMIQDGDKVFHGVSSHMPMIAVLLAKELHAPHAVHLNIPGGVDPSPRKLKKYTSAGSELLEGAKSSFPLMEVFDLSMRGGLDMAFLSGVQFDNRGNVNASVIGSYQKPKVRLPGGAGSAVLIPTAKRAVIWRTKHDKRTFVNQVDFITTKGNVDRIVTPLCIFKMENGKLVLDTIHETSTLKEVEDNTGFPVKYSRIAVTPSPTKTELSVLKRIDPGDFRNIEF